MNFFLVISLLPLKNLKLLPRFKNKLSQKDLKKIHTPSNKYQKKKPISQSIGTSTLTQRFSLLKLRSTQARLLQTCRLRICFKVVEKK